MALPKEPRQKMINLMYLVLTALLALNVSAEILNAFKTVDNSLDKTNNTVNISTENIMESFRNKLSDPTSKAKAEIWYPKAQQAQQLTSALYNDIEKLRNEILKAADFDPARKKDSTYKEDNQDIPTRIMIKEGKGKELQQKLAAYRAAMVNLVAPDKKAEFEKSLQVDPSMPRNLKGGNKTWEDAYFHMVPTVAALTILRKFENDVKTTENRVISHLHEQVGKVEVIFDAFEAIVGQNSKYLMPGQDLEITAGLGAFSKSKLPTISIGGSNVSLNEKGMAVYKVAAGTIGNHSVPVTVSFTDQDGKAQTRTFNVEYTVGQSNASIALDKMNVLYIGVDNPVSVAASGGGDDKVAVSISGGGGAISKIGAGKYNVRVSSPTEDCIITVSVDGKVAGSSRFRVRPIPAPVGTVGGFASGDNVNAGAFRAQAGVGAYIKDFPFDIQYDVVSYSISVDNDEGDIETADVQGVYFNSRAKQIINQYAKPGRTVTVDGLRAKGPDGRTFKIPSLVYYIK
ncbi:type IX secretion system motor protein PorM/GldM [Flavisolibacter nicotianae]|uniref:type IX secretion system motor protein PorM/GldM n=1 Tax=Flavisolibacter nicotianae TaxID=2364882 RepID=UPI000EAFFFA1|nr:gliding motility protein GldM [Flavisolibacter nicotianae]